MTHPVLVEDSELLLAQAHGLRSTITRSCRQGLRRDRRNNRGGHSAEAALPRAGHRRCASWQKTRSHVAWKSQCDFFSHIIGLTFLQSCAPFQAPAGTRPLRKPHRVPHNAPVPDAAARTLPPRARPLRGPPDCFHHLPRALKVHHPNHTPSELRRARARARLCVCVCAARVFPWIVVCDLPLAWVASESREMLLLDNHQTTTWLLYKDPARRVTPPRRSIS